MPLLARITLRMMLELRLEQRRDIVYCHECIHYKQPGHAKPGCKLGFRPLALRTVCYYFVQSQSATNGLN